MLDKWIPLIIASIILIFVARHAWYIAKHKGRNPYSWSIEVFLFFIVAYPILLALPEKGATQPKC
jgi:hypothetical protein